MPLNKRFTPNLAPLGVLLLFSSVTACNGSKAAHTTDTTSHISLAAIELTPSVAGPLSLPLGLTLHFTATGTYSDGSTAELTEDLTWASSDPSVATVSNDAGSRGSITGVAPGTTQITATEPASGITATASLSVIAGQLVSLAVTPVDPTILVGTTLQLNAWGILTDYSMVDMTSSVNWSTSDQTIATVSATGVASQIALGSATLTATDPVTGFTATTTVQGTTLPAVLSYLSLSRGSVVGGGSIQITGTVALTSVATDPITIALSSTDPTAASVPASVVIPAGSQQANFPVTTSAVTRRTRVTISATDGTLIKIAYLNVRVAH